MAKLAIKPGATSVSLYLFIQDSSLTTGAGLTGLLFNTASLTAYYVRPLGSATAITLATQTVTGAWSSGGFVEVSSTNMPGVYRFDVPDAVLASGVRSAVVLLKGATNMSPCVLEIDLNSESNVVAVNGGLTDGNNATLKLAKLDIQNSSGDAIYAASTGGNGNGANLQGNGSGDGAKFSGGTTGAGSEFIGGATSGTGLSVIAQNGNATVFQSIGGNGKGFVNQGNGTGAGYTAIGGSTGAGGEFLGGATSGGGLVAQAFGANNTGAHFQGGSNGTGLAAQGLNGIDATGSGGGAGMHLTGGATGDALKADGGATSGHGFNFTVVSGSKINSADFTGAVATDAGNSATSFKTNLTQTATDHWKNSFIRITSGSLLGQVRRVTGYNGTTKVITCDAFTGTPADGVTFDLINE